MLTIFCLIFDRLGEAFLSMLLRGWKAEGPKSIEKLFFFSIFALWGNWPTRSHMIDFSVNLVLNLRPQTHQNSTQEAPKIDKNRHRKYEARWLGL